MAAAAVSLEPVPAYCRLTEAEKRRSPRRLEMHPIYVLNLTIPSDELDASYEPRKALLGYKVGKLVLTASEWTDGGQ